MAEHVTIGDISPRIQYAADGAQTVFTYPFPIFEDGNLEVYLDDTLQASGFTIAGVGESGGGSVTFAAAPANAVTVTLRRQIAIARTTDFQEGGAFRAKTINDELDRLIAVAQEIRDDLGRTLQLAPTDPDAALELPDAADRAGNYLAFDEAGALIAAAPPLGDNPVSAFMATVLDDVDASSARTTLGLGTAAALNAGTGANNAVRLDGGAKLPSVDGSQLTNLPGAADAIARQMATLNAFRIAANGAISVQNYDDGFVDEFEDESGVDAQSPTQVPQGTGTAIGNMTGSGGLAVLFDSNTSQIATACAHFASSTGATAGKDWGASNEKQISTIKVNTPSNSKLDGNASTRTATIEVRGSSDGSATAGGNTLLKTFSSLNNNINEQLLMLDLSATDTSGYRCIYIEVSHDGGGGTYLAEIEFYEAVTGGSSGQIYDAAGDHYGNNVVSKEEGTRTGFGPGSPGFTFIERAFALTNGERVTHLAIKLDVAASGKLKIVERSAAGTYELKTEVAFSHTGGGADEYFKLASGYAVPVSGDFYVGSHSASALRSSTSNANQAFKNTDLTGGESGFTENSNSAPHLGARYGNISDMTLISQSISADAVPTDAAITLFAEEIDAIAENIDLKAWASRDGGATYTQITLTNEFTISHEGAALNVLTGGADISGQPSGTSMVWKITTHNTKEVRAHGVSLAWS